MIKDSGKKLFDVVLIWKFDRFARNRFDSANYKMILKKNGVHLISVMEPIAEGSQGILVETLLEGMAEYYSAELSEKVIRGQTENALKGKCTGGTGTIGYKIDEDKFYHLDPLTSPLVLEAFQRYDNGDKMVEIVNFLNNKGVRNMLGGKMTHSSVNTMLKNRRYIGELSFRDIVVPDAIPVIVPKDLFDRVQKRLDKNKRARIKRRWSFCLGTTRQSCNDSNKEGFQCRNNLGNRLEFIFHAAGFNKIIRGNYYQNLWIARKVGQKEN